MDVHSDVDLVVFVASSAVAEVMAERTTVLERLGPLLVAFIGEHVGEPRLMISLYGPPLLHVDVKFVDIADAAVRVEDPVVLWERDGAVRHALATREARWPEPEGQWIEDRFWVWVHYGATKVARGELFEALDFLSFLRSRVLAPLGARAQGRRARGVRFLERDLPDLTLALRATLAGHDAREIHAAMNECVALYRKLRASLASPGLVVRSAAEHAAVAYLEETAGAAVLPRS